MTTTSIDFEGWSVTLWEAPGLKVGRVYGIPVELVFSVELSTEIVFDNDVIVDIVANTSITGICLFFYFSLLPSLSAFLPLYSKLNKLSFTPLSLTGSYTVEYYPSTGWNFNPYTSYPVVTKCVIRIFVVFFFFSSFFFSFILFIYLFIFFVFLFYSCNKNEYILKFSSRDISVTPTFTGCNGNIEISIGPALALVAAETVGVSVSFSINIFL
jgi:hypothetical protein